MGKEITNEFQLFFSGVESDSYFSIVSKESNTMLMSYLYLQKKGKKFLDKRVKECSGLKLLIDSGAHTFLADAKGEYVKWDIEKWEEYLEGYTKWVRENKEHIFACVELDIDDLVGSDVVDSWREKFFKPLEEEGIQVIFVWHPIRKLTGWDIMCSKFPYVGFSYNADAEITPQLITKLFTTAKKYKSKIHGFGITGFDAMCDNPYYTSDSSTWLVGTQFGELNYFDGRTMKRLKKEKWKRQFKNKLVKLGANEALMMREEPYELIRINVLTFVEVEKHVRKRVKTKVYWLDKKQVEAEEEIEEYERGELPPDEWWEGEQEDWKSYAKALGIDTRVDKEKGVTSINLFRIFMNFDKDSIDQMQAEELFAYCDIFGLQGINTSKKALEALPTCFVNHAIGKSSEFGNLSEESDSESPEKAKEREDYIEEETHISMEVTKKECDSILAGFLSQGSDMPEVDVYDEELRRQGIIITRDDKGKFLKGHKIVRKPKKMYSDKMYKLSCSTCYKGADCPDYRAGYVCAYNKMFQKFNTRNKEDLMDAMHSIVESNVERLQIMMMFEKMDGGMVDANVTQLMDMNMKYLQMMTQIGNSNHIVAQRTVRVGDNGDVETVETVTSNGQAGGILERMFGGGAKAPAKDDLDKEEAINVTPEKE